jgi:cell division inhibitor SepF
VNTAPNESYEDQPKSVWTRLKDKFGWGTYDEYEDEYYEEPIPNRGATVKLHSARSNRVSVWLSVTSLENAQSAADGLKKGHQQIVNLEKASPEVTARVIDFLSGVIYALDGLIQKVGDKVYLFTPASFSVEVENGSTTRKMNSPFADN